MPAKKILLAEDDDALRSSLAFVLKSGGYAVLEASNGQDALDILKREQGTTVSIDLLITDIRMPGMSGVELLKALPDKGLDIPTVVISGHGDKDLLVDLLRLGCADFLPKPFEPSEVLEKLAGVLEKISRKSMEEDASATLRERNIKLDRDAEAARRDLEHLQREVGSAAAAYREIMDTSGLSLPLETVLRNRTYRELGGDYAGVCCSGSRCDLLVADVAGHDLAASYQTVLVKSFFDEYCRNGESGEVFFEKLNEELSESERNERMVTALLLQLDLARGLGTVISAGHPDLLRVKAGASAAYFLPARGDVLGLHREVRFEVENFKLSSGDRFFLYTDGLPGASRVDGPTGGRRIVTLDGLRDLVGGYAHQPVVQQTDSVWNYVLQFCRGRFSDDMLLFGVEIP